MAAREPIDPGPADPFERFARAGLSRLGLEASAEELAVMESVDSIYRPHFEALLAADFEDVDAEADLDPGRAP